VTPSSPRSDDYCAARLARRASRALDVADNWIGYTRLELAGFVIVGTARRCALRNGEYVDAYMMARNTAGPAGRVSATASNNE
jgi:hypothetical protein